MSPLPVTTAHLRVLRQSFQDKCLEGEVSAGGFNWQFCWTFEGGELTVEPSLGRALIQDALLRFLVKADYHLEALPQHAQMGRGDGERGHAGSSGARFSPLRRLPARSKP